MASANRLRLIERFARWNGSRFEPVASRSIDTDKVFILTHGWAPGMRSAVDAADGNLRAWDDGAATETGTRYDTWFVPLASEITRVAPDSTVLAFSWIDESATKPGNVWAIRSQMRTTVNGQRMAAAVGKALAESVEPAIHLIGFSHGARVVTIAATLMDPTPRQVTLLDSPEGALPVVGGALNDLTSYLRILTRPGEGLFEVEVDNYPSFFGVRYGRYAGVGRVVDVTLDPEGHPLDPESARPATIPEIASADHLYAPEWYVETARRDLDVGFGWSRLLGRTSWPPDLEQQQTGVGNPFALERVRRDDADDTPGEIVDRVRDAMERPRLLSTEGYRNRSGVAWRRRGDLMAVVPIRWVKASPNASLHVRVAGRERALAVRGWTETPTQRVAIPLGDVRWGPVPIQVRLESTEPATVEVNRATSIYQLPLPAFAEYRSWLFPAVVTTAVAGAVVALFAVRSALNLGRRVRRTLRS